MPLTDHDIELLAALGRYYVLTREQLQRLCFPDHAGGRTTRKRLSKLQQAGCIQKHRIPVAFPGTATAAPVYYATKQGAEYLASWYDDESLRAINTRQPRGDRLNHWIAVNETRIVIEQAVARQSDVTLDRWINEWETVDKDAAVGNRFTLHPQLSAEPPLSCSPDAAFLLSLRGHRKVYYLERDLGTSSPKQIAARKTKGYAALADTQGHRNHFPETTMDAFGVLFITTTRYRAEEAAKQIARKQRPDLWLFLDEHEVTAESFLHGAITWNHKLERGPLVKLPAGAPQTAVAARATADTT
ncbi:MAG: replication-relaxation family protein [Planctomycetaceae bacterium]|nr:replication-relaxation family protein [Planctomycetaceae bacterium]